ALLLRRHAPWPVAGRLGHPRRPPMRPRHRSEPDGNDGPAAVGGAVSPHRGALARRLLLGRPSPRGHWLPPPSPPSWPGSSGPLRAANSAVITSSRRHIAPDGPWVARTSRAMTAESAARYRP